MVTFDFTKFKENLEKQALNLLDSDEETIGWRYLGSVPYSDCFPSDKLILETDESGWLETFKICILHEDSSIIILANDDCPDYYYNQLSEDIKKIILDCLKDFKPAIDTDELITKYWYKYDNFFKFGNIDPNIPLTLDIGRYGSNYGSSIYQPLSDSYDSSHT